MAVLPGWIAEAVLTCAAFPCMSKAPASAKACAAATPRAHGVPGIHHRIRLPLRDEIVARARKIASSPV